MIFRHTGLSRHLILIGLQGRTRFCNGIDDPQRFHIPLVCNDGCKILGVGRPVSPRTPAFAITQSIRVQRAVRNAIPEIRCSVTRQAHLHDGAVLLILPGLSVIGNAHVIQIAIFGINHPLSVWRYGSPVHLLRFFLLVLQVCQLLSGIVVREIERRVGF